METKHTEPPFHIAFHPQSDEYSIHSMPSHPQDAGPNVLSAKHVGIEQAKANAKLFSAAPESIIRLDESTRMLESIILLYGENMSVITKFGIKQQISQNKQVIKKAFE